jgi:glycosyltransferase involved in cell wall biosynthesis
MDKDIKVSIAIPCYEMSGNGGKFLEYNLTKIHNQTYKNIEVVISDHSSDDVVKGVVDEWLTKLDIKYIRNTYKIGSSSANINTAMKNCTGDIIKIIFQDDFLFNDGSIKDTVDVMGESNWLVSTCEHTYDGLTFHRKHTPFYNNKIHLGINTISSPSVLTIRNTDIQYFDEDLIWLMDVDYYKKLYIKYGEPLILNTTTVVNRMWENQVSNMLSDVIKNNEVNMMINKYGES